jgi:hypothetical protein
MLFDKRVVFLDLDFAFDGLFVLGRIIGVALAGAFGVSDGDEFYEVILCHCEEDNTGARLILQAALVTQKEASASLCFMVRRVGFEPTKPEGNAFTARPR